jgi:hypothetical protein
MLLSGESGSNKKKKKIIILPYWNGQQFFKNKTLGPHALPHPAHNTENVKEKKSCHCNKSKGVHNQSINRRLINLFFSGVFVNFFA